MQNYITNNSTDIITKSEKTIANIINKAMDNLTVEERFNLIELIQSRTTENLTLAIELIKALSGEELSELELLYFCLYRHV